MIWLVAPDGRPDPQVRRRNVGYPLQVRQQPRPREELGVEFRPAETTLVDHFQQMIDDGLVRDKR